MQRTPMRFVSLLITLVVCASCAKSEPRFAVVDVQRALVECKQGLEAKARLKARFDERQTALNTEQARLKVEVENAGDDDVKRRKIAEDLTALKAQLDTAQQELKDLEASETAAMMKPLGGVLDALAKERHYQAVLDVAAVPWAATEVNVTDEVIKRMNAL